MKRKMTEAQTTVMGTLYDVATHEGGAIILKNRYHSAAAALVRKGLVRKIDRTPWRPLYVITVAGFKFMQNRANEQLEEAV